MLLSHKFSPDLTKADDALYRAENMEDFTCYGTVARKCADVWGLFITLTHGLNGSCSCGVTQLQGVDEYLSPPLSTG